MEIKSLQNLKRNGVVYELYTDVIETNSYVGIYKFTCTERHNMRLDLVCYDIYHNTDSLDILTIINGILNPLTIQNGDILLFVNPDDLTTVRSNTGVIEKIIKSIKNANAGKQQKKDANKIIDNANKASIEKSKDYIPPNILQAGKNIDYGEGTIILRPNF